MGDMAVTPGRRVCHARDMTATPRATTLHTAVHGTRRIVVRRVESWDRRGVSRFLYQLLIDDVNVVSVRSDEHALIYALPQFAAVVARDRPARSASPEATEAVEAILTHNADTTGQPRPLQEFTAPRERTRTTKADWQAALEQSVCAAINAVPPEVRLTAEDVRRLTDIVLSGEIPPPGAHV